MVTRVKGTSDFAEKGVRGLAEAVKVNEHNLRIDFDDNLGTFEIKVDTSEKGRNIPEYFQFSKMKNGGKVRVSATMSKDGDEVLFMTPAQGTFTVKLNKMIVKGEGKEPAPETKPGRNGKKDYQVFSVLLEITKGAWAGANFFYQMYPRFAPDEDGNLAVSGSGSGSDALYDFLEATGVNKHTIPFSENPLPEIQKIALEEALEFEAVVQKGWVDMIVVPLTEDAFGAEENIDDIHPALK